MISAYGLGPPFLDFGTGQGDLSHYLSLKGWSGRAVDTSESALAHARTLLAGCTAITVENETIFDVPGSFNTIFMWDVLEHIKDDKGVLQRASELLRPGGYLLLCVPSNPVEWRWDDEFYGHYRRYSPEGLSEMLTMAGFEVTSLIDCTYPVFWLMRRVYTLIKSPPEARDGHEDDLEGRSARSSLESAWEIPLVSKVIASSLWGPLWRLVYIVQHRFFKDRPERGWELFALAKKRERQANLDHGAQEEVQSA